MTETERKALELVNEVSDGFHDVTSIYDIHTAKTLRSALCRAIEQHDAFRQEVSDAVVATYNNGCSQHPYVSPRDYMDGLQRFIIAKPDPLVEVMNEMGFGWSKTASEELRAALAARGLKIVEVGHD